jgi:hypothetical protein
MPKRRRRVVVIIQKHVRKWLVQRASLKFFHTVLLEKGVSNKGIPKA